MPAAERLAFDVALHIGTLAAVVIYFRGDLLALAGGLVGRPAPPYARTWIWLLAVATVPVGLAGVFLKHHIETSYDSLPVIGICFIVTGSLLYLASAVRGAHRSAETLGMRDALVVGLFQVVALLPGVSRSGTTISGAMFRRIRPEIAARFSFLLAIPAIAGAVVVEGRPMLDLGPAMRVPMAVGILVALATGLAAIAVLLRAVVSGRLHWFGYYCWALGAIVLVGSLVAGMT
jgi:undecaprenyl-diphosphatase